MHTALTLAVAVIVFAAGLRVFWYVDLEDGLAIGLAFCAVYFVVAHFAS